jgi:hypothetical protein
LEDFFRRKGKQGFAPFRNTASSLAKKGKGRKKGEPDFVPLDWPNLVAFARFDIGLDFETFMSLSPFEFFCLRERWLTEQEQRDFRTGLVACILANANRGKRKKAFKIEDFLPNRRGDKGKKGKKEQHWQDQLDVVKGLHHLFGGKPVSKNKAKGMGKMKRAEKIARGLLKEGEED